MIEADLVASGGKLAPLLAKYRGRASVEEAAKGMIPTALSCAVDCSAEKIAEKNVKKLPVCDSLCGPDRLDKRFPLCFTSMMPWFQLNWADYLVLDNSTEELAERAKYECARSLFSYIRCCSIYFRR